MSFENNDANSQVAVPDRGDRGGCGARTPLHPCGLGYVIDFMSTEAVHSVPHTLAAVSRQMRVETEVLVDTPVKAKECVFVTMSWDQKYCLLVAKAEASPEPPQIAPSLWWVRACHLPLEVKVNNARSDVLRFLDDGLRDRVEVLRVEITSLPSCAQRDITTCDGRCGSFLCALPAFTNLKRLTVDCSRRTAFTRSATYVTRILRMVARLPTTMVTVNGALLLSDISTLSGAEHLRTLTATACQIADVSALCSCSNLVQLDLSENRRLQNLSSLVGARSLETLCARGCCLQHLDGLSTFPWLDTLDVAFNHAIQTTRGLAGVPCLRTLDFSFCDGLHSLEGLSDCPCLEKLVARACENLTNFAGLVGAPSLRNVNAKSCRLLTVDGLSDCPLLEEIDVSDNHYLLNVSSLAGAVSLKFPDLSFTSVSHVAGLHRCPALEHVVFTGCYALEDISGLGGARRLKVIDAWDTSIRSVTGLGRCSELEKINLHCCERLEDITDLSRCRKLRTLNVRATLVGSTEFLSSSVLVLR